MSVLKSRTVKKLFESRPDYQHIDTFIETGTFLAKTIRNMQGLFANLHTIELADGLYEQAVKAYGHLDINFHHGDSKILLPRIAKTVKGPIFFYLDAHVFAHADVADSFPLWEELEYIRGRKEADIVAIDDVGTWGNKKSSTPGFAGLTPRKILDFLGPNRNNGKLIENNTLIILRNGVVV